MKNWRHGLAALASAAILPFSPIHAQDDLNPIMPEVEAVNAGLAGETPPNVARFLMARGAQSAQISPDGRTIAFRQLVTGAPQIWVVPVTGGQPKQITFGNGAGFFAWSPDSSSLLYGADNNGDEREAYYLISADGASERLILPATENGFRSFGSFSPDGKSIAFSSTERNGSDFDIYITSLETGETRMVFEGVFYFGVEDWSPDGETLIVSETVGEDGNNLYTLDADTGELEALYASETPANFTSGFGGGASLAFAPDSSGFYFSKNNATDFLTLGFHDLRSGEFRQIESVAMDLEQPVLCGERYLAYLANDDGFSRLKIRDLQRNRMVSPPSLPEGVYDLSCARENAQMAIRVSAFDRPGDVYAWMIGDRAAKRVFTSTMAGLPADALVKPVSLKIPASDGVMLQGLLYMPNDVAEGEKPPVLFVVHGGPTAQSKPAWSDMTQYHVARGTAVFVPNVRGSTGFGRTYLSLDNQKKRLDSVRDLVDMLDFLESDGRVDASRAIVKGGSYGGYMVNAVLSEYPDAFSGGVALFGVGDWVTALQVASPALKAADRIEYGDIREQEWIDYYTEYSPVRNADKITVPVLYSHGAMDPRIDKAETEIMVRALRARGIDAPYILFPDEGHGWRKLKNQIFYAVREAEFVESVFGEAD